MAQYIEAKISKKGREKADKKDVAKVSAPAGQPKGRPTLLRDRRLL
jgi:hypothetical protein